MDFGGAAAASQQQQHGGGLSFLDEAGGVTATAKISSARSVGGSGKERATGVAGNHIPSAAAGAGAGAADRPPLLQQLGLFSAQQHKREIGSDSSSSSMLATTPKCTRTAKNGREQQRAQKISDMIDQLKVNGLLILAVQVYLHTYFVQQCMTRRPMFD